MTTTKSEIFTRAWEFYNWNGGCKPFGLCLKQAWKEVKNGASKFWNFAKKETAKQKEIKEQITFLEMQTRLGVHGMKKLGSLNAQLRAA